MSNQNLPPLERTSRVREPGEIWEADDGGLVVVLSSRLYNESNIRCAIVAAVSAPPPVHDARPLIVPAGLNEHGQEVAVYVDRLHQMPHAWLRMRRGTLAPKALDACDRHLQTLFMR